MIIVMIQGGLGNQIFQYAFYKNLKKSYNNCDIKLDISSYLLPSPHQGYELDSAFCDLDLKYVSTWELFKKINIYPQSKNSVVSKLMRNSSIAIREYEDKLMPNHKKIYSEIEWENNKNFINVYNRDLYIHGFFANRKFYESIISDLKNELIFRSLDTKKNKELMQLINSKNSVGIHVRRGDYIGSDFCNLDMEYYIRAINKVKKILSNPYFFVFSDDVLFVKKQFAFLENKIIVDWNTEKESFRDMQLMSNCKHNIIANSTFSYWAAELNKNKQKLVIAPKKYLMNGENNPMLQTGWIAL